MTLEDARRIYDNPKGHPKRELIECLQALNSQENILSPLQYLAIADAHKRLGVPMLEVTDLHHRQMLETKEVQQVKIPMFKGYNEVSIKN